jgi:mannobiose 2-epimerase
MKLNYIMSFGFVAMLGIITMTSTTPSSAHTGPAMPKLHLSAEDRSELTTIHEQVRHDLVDNVMPFWTRYTVDPNGGFNTVVDLVGKPINNQRFIVMQARTVWTLSSAQRYGVKNAAYLEMARKGAHFIADKMWDNEYGGFYMIVNPDGSVVRDDKYLYCQEFALYAFAEYSRVAPSREEKEWALGWCSKIFNLIQDKCRDHQNPGYREDFDRKWDLLPESIGVGGIPSGKTLNTHMHLMEAFTALVDADPQPKYKQALEEVTDLLLEKSYDKVGHYAKEPFDMAWNPIPEGKGRLSTYLGHDVEFAWLLIDAMNALGRNPDTIKPQILNLIDEALEHGFDHENGGIAEIGPRGKQVVGDPAYKDDLSKQWWEQAEALTAFSMAYRWTGDQKYLTAFEKEWSWVYKHQIDHVNGDWFADTDWYTGVPRGGSDKGLGGWKTSYHNGRALMRTGEQLELILEGSQKPI